MNAQPTIRLLLADVDGTLLTNDKVLTGAARAACRDLREAGIQLAITSSRPPRGMAMLIEPLTLQGAIAGCNGAVFVNPDLSVIETHTLDPATARRITELILEHGADPWVYTIDAWLLRDRAAPRVAREEWILKFDATTVASFTDADLRQVTKIVGVSDDTDLLARCETAMRAALGATASVALSSSYFLDVTDPQANKGAVVTTLARRLNIPPEQIATIGDMPNDVLMFKQCGFSIAMGNASDAVKGQASAITDSNENEGFAKAIRTFILRAAAA